jgi:multiple sugar transport system substrate-binding protein
VGPDRAKFPAIGNAFNWIGGLKMKIRRKGMSRREMLKTAAVLGAAGAAGIGANIVVPGRAKAAKKLTILQWNHFVPAYDEWFNKKWIKEWGEKNDTEVTVDNINNVQLPDRMAAEASAKKGHDLFMRLDPPSVYEELVIDHKEIYDEVAKKWGKPIDLALKSTYNPKTKKYFGFSDMYVPDPINYSKPLWDEVGVNPDSWDNILKGGTKIKKTKGIPVGIGLSNELDTSMALRALMYSHGAHEQDANGNLTLKSKETLACLRYMKALYQGAMTPEVLSWDPSSNNRAMLAGKISLALNAISITRTAETQKLPISKDIWLNRAAKGPKRQMGLEHVMSVYTIWEFAENKEGAKKFLIDLVDNYQAAFEASAFYNFPCFPKTVSNLQELVKNDKVAEPKDKYSVLGDSLRWATNVGYPGYSNAAISDAYNTWVIPVMFAKAATGNSTPEEALNEANEQCKQIWAKWKEKKMI